VKDAAPKGESDENKDGQGERGRDDGKNKMLSELRIVRILQARVNEETVDVDGRRARAEAELSPEVKEKIGTVREHQAQVRDTLGVIDRAARERGG
jgi:hypothetical protein